MLKGERTLVISPIYDMSEPITVRVQMSENHLKPGVCTVCRKGKIKSHRTWCTWIMCLVLLPLGILPGIIAFCCCCKEPKCTECGYTV